MKRSAELRDLSDDHHTALVLARRCRSWAKLEAAESLASAWRQVHEAFAAHLAPHFEIEERHLLPGLEAIGEAQLADRIRADHAALRALVEAPAPSPAAIERFGRLLESHVRFEEREAFEVAQSRLPPGALRAVADACRSIPRSCPTFLA
jgi:hemerythrin-like domain-containing protein